jgi:hypothetical protein
VNGEAECEHKAQDRTQGCHSVKVTCLRWYWPLSVCVWAARGVGGGARQRQRYEANSRKNTTVYEGEKRLELVVNFEYLKCTESICGEEGALSEYLT